MSRSSGPALAETFPRPSGRPRVYAARRLTRSEVRAGSELTHPAGAKRPRVRADCAVVPRPCPWVSCRHHLFLDVNENGSLRLNFPGLEVADLPLGGCALDAAEDGARTLDELGVLLNLTRERSRQLEVLALARLEAAATEAGLGVRRTRRTPPDSGEVRYFGETEDEVEKERTMRVSKLEKLPPVGQEIVAAAVRGEKTVDGAYHELREGGYDVPSLLGTRSHIQRRRALLKRKRAEEEGRKVAKNPVARQVREVVDRRLAGKPNGNGNGKKRSSTPKAKPVVGPPVTEELEVDGYYVLPDGRIWTPSAEAALELFRRLST